MTQSNFLLQREEIYQVLVKIYESGLMNKGHDTITRANLQRVVDRFKEDQFFKNILTVQTLEKILWDTHYLMPLVADSDVLRFNTKNFQKVIQDDKRTKKLEKNKNGTDKSVPKFDVTFKHILTTTTYHASRTDTTPGPTHLFDCPLCLSSFAKVECYERHVEDIHKTTLNNPTRRGWASDGPKFFDFKLKLTTELDLSLGITNLLPCRTTIKNILIAAPKKKFQRIEHGLAERLDYGSTADIPLLSSFFDSTNCKYRLIVYGIDHGGVQLEEHHWLQLPKPLSFFVKSIRSAELAVMRPKSSRNEQGQRLPEHTSDKEIRKFFNDKWYLHSFQKAPPLTANDRRFQLLHGLDNNRAIFEKNYCEEFKLLNSVEDLYVLEKVEEAVFEYRQIGIEQSGVFWTRVNEFDLQKLSGVIGECDFIVLEPIGKNQEFIGIIEGFENSKLFFTLNPGKMASTKHNYNIFFEKNRASLRMEQQALSTLSKNIIHDYILPREYGAVTENFKIFEWCDKSLENNPEQQQAVTNILNCSSYPAPYLLFGPPGTGKTTTIVEAVYQIWKFKPGSRILVSTPSNYACDELTKRLLKVLPETDLYRYYAKSIEKRKNFIDPDVLRISNLNDGIHEVPTKNFLLTHRIILSTLANVGRLPLNNFGKDVFSYIFIDEAGSSKEPQTIIPLAGLISEDNAKKTMLVLAGDPKQLGPIVSCKTASDMGLGTSMLERLMNRCNLYSSKPHYNQRVLTKLIQNYRSHQAILQVPNKLFYANELVACGKADMIGWACDWKELPNKNKPIIFHNVNGRECFDRDSPSYYNLAEVSIIMEYVGKIVSKPLNGKSIPLNEIGIVTPYLKQAKRIREELKSKKLDDITVATVEAFQGQERMIIIMSTVRAGTGQMGFLKNSKRMNVAVTRAKGLLIIVGCADTLKTDKNWRELLRYYKRNQAVKGDSFNLPANVSEIPEDENGVGTVNGLIGGLEAVQIAE